MPGVGTENIPGTWSIWSSTDIPARFREYVAHIGIALLLLVFLLSKLPKNLADPDLWGYLAFGRLFWETGQFPYHDVFAYVPTKSVWIYHEWLTGILYYPIFRYAEAGGLQIVKIILMIGTVSLTWATARRREAGLGGIALVIFLTHGFLSGYSPVRAQIFTYFFFALTLYILEVSRQTQTWQQLLWLMPIQVCWCNIHGGFLAGLGLIAIFTMGEALSQRRFMPYLGALILSGLATLINPYGLDYWTFMMQAASMSRPEIEEWLSLAGAFQKGLYVQQVYYFLAITVLGGLLLWSVKWKDLTAGLVLAVTWYLAFRHIRHLVFFLLVLQVYLAEPLSHYLKSLRKLLPVTDAIKRLAGRVVIAIVLIMLSIFTYNFLSAQPLHLTTPALPGTQGEMYYPVGAVNYIRANHLAGKILSEFRWGEYILWKLYPENKVAMDGRYETVYPDEVFQDFITFIHAKPGWEKFLDTYPPDMILLQTNSAIYALMQGDHKWRQIYVDSGCGLFIKKVD